MRAPEDSETGCMVSSASCGGVKFVIEAELQTRKARPPPGTWLRIQVTVRPGIRPKERRRERVAGGLAIQTMVPAWPFFRL